MSAMCRKMNFVECHLAVALWQIFSPLFLVVGILGNIVSIAVLSRQRMRHTTTSVYLRLLAVVDTVVLFVALPRQLVYMNSFVNFKNMGVFACKFVSFLIPTSTTLSWCFLPIITIDRLILVRYPIWAKKHCTRKTALVVFAALVITIIAANLHALLYLNIRWKDVVSTNATNITTAPVRVVGRCLGVSKRYEEFRKKIWPLIIFLIFSLTPIILQIVCNILLVRELVIRSRKRQSNRAIQDNNEREQRDLRSVTRMLVVISVFFIFSSVPQCTQLVLQPYIFKPRNAHNTAKNLLLQAFIQLLMYCNNTVNFLLYTLSGQVFRKELLCMCEEVRRKVLYFFGSNVVYPNETASTGQTTTLDDTKQNVAIVSGSKETTIVKSDDNV